MEYQEFLLKLQQIQKMGWVKSHREGDTGIGKTLEDLLGISENNISGPDFSNYELKSGRKNSPSMLTLFTKTPQPYGAIGELLKNFGYPNRKTKNITQMRFLLLDKSEISPHEKELHVTVDSLAPNTVGLKLKVKNNRLYIDNVKGIEAYYDQDTLRQCFEQKYDKLIYVLADSKGTRDNELFFFNEAYLLESFNFENFSRLIQAGKLKVDLRVGHYPDGRLHDHGTGFRILPKDLPESFERIQRIL